MIQFFCPTLYINRVGLGGLTLVSLLKEARPSCWLSHALSWCSFRSDHFTCWTNSTMHKQDALKQTAGELKAISMNIKVVECSP